MRLSKIKNGLLLCLLLLPLQAWAGDDEVIAVTGRAEVAMVPDMALVNLIVMREAETAAEALNENSQALEGVLGALHEEGIESRDIQTSQFSIDPRYIYPDHNKPRQLVGYTVRNGLSLRIRDLSKLGALLDKVVTLGVNEGGNIQFINEDPAEAVKQARVQAVQNAMNTAKTLAEAAGVKLGDLVHLAEQSAPPRAQPVMLETHYAKTAARSAVPVAVGENHYSVSVSMSYEIKQ